MIDKVKEAFDEVAGRPNFGDEPKNFTSRMMWIAIIAIIIAGAMLVYAFFFSVPRSQADECINKYDNLQREYNSFLKTMIPEAQQSKSETNDLKRQVDSLESVVEKQNPIIQLYNKRR